VGAILPGHRLCGGIFFFFFFFLFHTSDLLGISFAFSKLKYESESWGNMLIKADWWTHSGVSDSGHMKLGWNF
jgi:hypothetical protein